jgi:hypothetical protein
MLKLNTKPIQLLVPLLILVAVWSINLLASNELVDSWKAWIPALWLSNNFGQLSREPRSPATRSLRIPPASLYTPVSRPVSAIGLVYDYLESPNINPRHWANILKPEAQAFIRALIQFVIFHKLLDYDSSANYQESYPAEAYPLDSALSYSFIWYIANQPGATPLSIHVRRAYPKCTRCTQPRV